MDATGGNAKLVKEVVKAAVRLRLVQSSEEPAQDPAERAAILAALFREAVAEAAAENHGGGEPDLQDLAFAESMTETLEGQIIRGDFPRGLVDFRVGPTADARVQMDMSLGYVFAIGHGGRQASLERRLQRLNDSVVRIVRGDGSDAALRRDDAGD